MDKIAVLIPCYNEEKTIAKVVSDVKKFLLRTPYLYTMLPLNGSLEIKILSTPLSLICPIIHSRSA